MPEEKLKPSEELIDVGETEGAEINLDEKGVPEKPEEPKEEKIEVEQVEAPAEDKTFENERETKLEKKEEKDELKEYSEGVQKRIAKLTRKMREAERQREEALRYADSVKKERDEFKSQANTLDKDYTTEMENRISGQLAAAQAKLTAARQNEDAKAETEALADISQLGYEQGKLAELKTQHQMQETAAKEKTVEQPNLYQQPRQEPQTPPDPKAEAWAEDNEWFGKDSAMTYTAFDLHRKLTEEEGIDPRSDEYYTEIDKRIRLEFPHKFDKSKDKPVSKPTQTVASATRSPKTNRKSVRLTSSQVAIAKKLGVPLEEYAKQLMNTKEV